MRAARPPTDDPHEETADGLDDVLAHWGLAGAPVLSRLPGAALRCVIARRDQRFVLRQVCGDRAYLEYQLRVLQHLARLEFPYRVPHPLPTRDGAPLVATAEGDWLLYRWIAGRPAPPPITTARAADFGRLVGETDRALASFALHDRSGYFRLPLFQGGGNAAVVTDATRWLAANHPQRRLTRALTADGQRILDAAADAAYRADAIADLATPTIYDDWHRRNLLAHHGRIVGLVDFDSLVEAPRIVDLANALIHLLATVPLRRIARLAAFAGAYGAVFALSAQEADLVTAAMLDRLVELLATTLASVRASDAFGPTAGLAAALVRLGGWLADRQPRVTATLATHARGAAT